MCLFGVSMMNNHIYGSKVPQKPHFGGLSRHFKPNVRKIQIAISSDLCIRLTWNLTGSCGQQQRLRVWSRMVVKQFQDGRRPPFWKLIYRHSSVKNHRFFVKFYTQQQILNWMNVTWSKMKKLHWTNSEFDRTYFLLQLIFTYSSLTCSCTYQINIVVCNGLTALKENISSLVKLWCE